LLIKCLCFENYRLSVISGNTKVIEGPQNSSGVIIE
jgi:hypothetical protein